MTAGHVPTTNLLAFYANTTPDVVISSANIDAAIADLVAAINDNYDVYATLAAAGGIGTANIANLAVTTAKIALLAVTAAQIANATITTTQLATGAVTSTNILDGTILNVDINASAAIDGSKLASGSVTSTQILDGTLLDADVNAAAAIAWTKLNKTGSSLTDFTTRSAADLSSGILLDARMPDLTGDITTIEGGVFTSIASNVIVNADINSSAAIDASKIADGTVSSAEFQFINSLSSNAQTQLDNKAPLTHVGSNGTAQHAVADGSNAGFMSAAHYTIVANATTVYTGGVSLGSRQLVYSAGSGAIEVLDYP